MNNPPPYYIKSRMKNHANQVWGTSAVFSTLEEAKTALAGTNQAPTWEFAIFHQGQRLEEGEE